MLCTLIGAIVLSINIHVGLDMHLYDDIGDASSSLRGSTSSLKYLLKMNFFNNLKAWDQKNKFLEDTKYKFTFIMDQPRSETFFNKFQCFIYQWIRLNEMYKLMESFFRIRFRYLFCPKAENFSNEFVTNSNTLFLSHMFDVVATSMNCLNELYKLMEIFSNFEFVFKFLSENYKKNSNK